MQLLRTVSLGILVAAGSVAIAAAADAPVVKPYTTPTTPPVADWAGLYAGLSLGYAFGDHDAHPPAGGPPFTSWSSNGLTLGGVLGYNWQNGRWIYGVEGALNWADIEGSTNNLAGTGPGTSRINSIASLAGRLGWVTDNDWLVFAKGGVAQARGELSGAGLAPTTTRKATHDGWTVGVGIEKKLANGFSARLGINYYDFDRRVYNPAHKSENWDIQFVLTRIGIGLEGTSKQREREEAERRKLEDERERNRVRAR